MNTIGSIILYSGSTVPEHFLVCDGSAVSRDDYSELFEVIGSTYGIGDGSTTFNLPNLVGKVAMGSSSSYAMGASGGEETHELTSGEIPEHDHEVPSHSHASTISATTPELTHSVTQAKFTYSYMNGGGNHGGGNSSAVSYYNSNTTRAMSRSANAVVADHAAGNCTMSGGIIDCPSFDTGSVGSGAAHDNMMPYLAVMYIIRYEPDVPPVLEPNMVMYGNSVMVMTAGGSYLKSRKSL